jgi:hypothetical protein
MRKTIYTLNVGDYAPAIRRLTYPLLQYYAQKIGAEFFEITERRFPEWPITTEKLQIHELAKLHGNDWNIFFDADALVHPETIDFTNMLSKDVVLHHGADMAAVRWRYDPVFLRDGRNIGSCNWCTMASDWCLDLWRMPDDLTPAEAVANIFPTVNELTTIITPDHLVDDYLLSRNIARFGLHFTTIMELLEKSTLKGSAFFWHTYTDTIEKKVQAMLRVLVEWQAHKLPIYPAGVLADIAATAAAMTKEAKAK